MYKMQKKRTMEGRFEYAAPQIRVIHLAMEGFLAISYDPVISAGNVEYQPYDTASPEEGDLLLY
jgi:hypothetical protein